MSYNDDDLGYLLNKASRFTKWELNNKLGEIGLTSSQWEVLKDLYMYEKMEDDNVNHTPASIAQRLRYDRPTISGIIERLVKQGWAYRVMNTSDRRSHMIMLTDKARWLMPKMEGLRDNAIQEAIKSFNKSELVELKKYLSRIINNFDEQVV